jgi:hypothetical protein
VFGHFDAFGHFLWGPFGSVVSVTKLSHDFGRGVKVRARRTLRVANGRIRVWRQKADSSLRSE